MPMNIKNESYGHNIMITLSHPYLQLIQINLQSGLKNLLTISLLW